MLTRVLRADLPEEATLARDAASGEGVHADRCWELDLLVDEGAGVHSASRPHPALGRAAVQTMAASGCFHVGIRPPAAPLLPCSRDPPSSLNVMPSTGPGTRGSLGTRKPQRGQTGQEIQG